MKVSCQLNGGFEYGSEFAGATCVLVGSCRMELLLLMYIHRHKEDLEDLSI